MDKHTPPPLDLAHKLLQLFLKQGRVSTDSRKIQTGDIFFALKGENFNGNVYAAKALEAGASYVVIDEEAYQQPKDERYILVPHALKALQDLARAYRAGFDIPIIGITGSNGKTTTKELVHAVLKTERKAYATTGNFNNHIGVPLSLLAMPKDTEIAIIEMGANQPGDIAELAGIARPTHAIITNIGEAHLERFKNIEGVRKTKGELFDFIRVHGGVIFLNEADEQVKIAANEFPQFITYGTDNADFQLEIQSNLLNEMTVSISYRHWKHPQLFHSQLSGSYNAYNILAAVVIGSYFQIPLASIKAGIAAYLPTNNRSQILKRSDYTICLDAYNANPSSMRASISNLFSLHSKGKIALILGDMYELGKNSREAHRALGHFINTFEPYMTIGIGPQMQYALEVIRHPHVGFEDVSVAREEIADLISGADLLLLKGSRGMALERLLEVI